MHSSAQFLETFAIPVFIFFIIMLGFNAGLKKRDATQARLEAKIDLLLQNAGLQFAKDVPPSVMQAIQAGNKIAAIKLYREMSGVGLKQAKDFVEDAQKRYHIR